jgi:hypothetical protein
MKSKKGSEKSEGNRSKKRSELKDLAAKRVSSVKGGYTLGGSVTTLKKL